MVDLMGELDASIQAKLEADSDFQTAIASLSDEEKTTKIAERKSEEMNKELSLLKEEAAKAAKAQELADNYKIRAEKAEARKVPSKEQKETGKLDNKDILYLAKADIHEDDLDDVTELASLKKISVSEAHQFMKPILAVRAEERRTAAATHTKGGARGTTTVTGEDLLRQAQTTGEIPEDEESLNKVFQARLARKTAKFQNRKR